MIEDRNRIFNQIEHDMETIDARVDIMLSFDDYQSLFFARKSETGFSVAPTCFMFGENLITGACVQSGYIYYIEQGVLRGIEEVRNGLLAKIEELSKGHPTTAQAALKLVIRGLSLDKLYKSGDLPIVKKVAIT